MFLLALFISRFDVFNKIHHLNVGLAWTFKHFILVGYFLISSCGTWTDCDTIFDLITIAMLTCMLIKRENFLVIFYG